MRSSSTSLVAYWFVLFSVALQKCTDVRMYGVQSENSVLEYLTSFSGITTTEDAATGAHIPLNNGSRNTE